MNVMLLLTPRRTSITKDSAETHGHMTTHYDSLMEKQHIAEGPYLETIAYCGCHINTTYHSREASSVDMTVTVTKCTEAKCNHMTL